nr:MAG TPA: hypothetical protein [Caudoviricetes sp.]
MYQQYNPNPRGKNVGDCTVRAIAKATGKEWGEAYLNLAVQGYLMGDMPSANACWGAYLRKLGFVRRMLPDSCPECYTLREFAEDYDQGTYIVALSGHVVCVEDGVIWDSWDSGGEAPLYYWVKEH